MREWWRLSRERWPQLVDLNLGDVTEGCLPLEQAVEARTRKMLARNGQGPMRETVACLSSWEASKGLASS